MKNIGKVYGGIIFALVVAVVVLFSKLNSVESDITLLRNDISHFTSTTRDQIASIYNNVDERLKKEASLFSEIGYTIGELLSGNKTTTLNISLVPKSISDDTAVFVEVGDNKSELTRNGNVFSGAVEMSIFASGEEHPKAYIQENGVIKTELLENVYLSNTFMKFLPNLFSIIPFSDYKNGELVFDDLLRIEAYPATDLTTGSKAIFEKVELAVYINGKEADRKDITNEVAEAGYMYDGRFDGSYKLNYTDVLEVYIEAVDTYDFTHKSLAHFWKMSEDGATAETIVHTTSIYDENGNLIYGNPNFETQS